MKKTFILLASCFILSMGSTVKAEEVNIGKQNIKVAGGIMKNLSEILK